MARRKINVDEAVELYEAGATSVQLAERYKATHPSILKALRKAGVKIRPPRRGSVSRHADKADKVAALYRDGLNMSSIADRLGIGRSTIRRLLIAKGIKPRPHGLREATITMPDDPYILGYLAGLFDGEGNLQTREKHGGNSISCKIAIYNTEPRVMDWLCENVGGKIRWDHARTVRHGWKPMGIWAIYRALDVKRFLEATLPLLIVKREQAVRMLEVIREKVDVY